MANDLIVKYESAFGEVTLDPETVTKYLARGNTAMTPQEIRLFIELCKYQKLNPFVGEAYAVKFGSDFQMIVGYDTYKRRGEENPDYRGRRSGIVVVRNNTIEKREGTCLYPGDTLVGGWCKVYRMRGTEKDETYAEVSLAEYQKFNKEGKPQSNWGSKPATMIRKVAVSQALRDAFPTQYTGLHTEYEMPNGQEGLEDGAPSQQASIEGNQPITKIERKALFDLAHQAFGKERGNELIMEIIQAMGLESTQSLDRSAYIQVMDELKSRADAFVPPADDDFPDPDFDGDDYGRPDDAGEIPD